MKFFPKNDSQHIGLVASIILFVGLITSFFANFGSVFTGEACNTVKDIAYSWPDIIKVEAIVLWLVSIINTGTNVSVSGIIFTALYTINLFMAKHSYDLLIAQELIK